MTQLDAEMNQAPPKKVREVRKSPMLIEQKKKLGEHAVWVPADEALAALFSSTQEALRAIKQEAKPGVYRIISIKRDKIQVAVETKETRTIT